MIRRDWVKRQVEIIAQALGAVLGLKGRGEVQAAAVECEAAVRKACGMDPKLAAALPFPDFLSLFLRGNVPEPGLLEKLAELFGEWGELLERRGAADEAALARERARELRERAAELRGPGSPGTRPGSGAGT